VLLATIPTEAPELIFSVIYGYRPDGTVSLNEEEEGDLDETIRRVLDKIKAAKAAANA
jgi:hypothetical protein